MRVSAVLVFVLVSACSSSEDRGGAVAALPNPPAETYGTPVPAPAPWSRAGEATSPIAHQQDRVTPVMTASFEPASAGCNDWAAEGAEAIRSVPPHSGDYACKICATGDAPDIAIAHAGGALEPGRYVLTAWMRRRADLAGPEGAVAVLEATTASGAVTATTPLVLGDDYARVSVTLDLDRPATSIHARIGAPAIKQQCVLIDDVLVERVR